MENKKLTLGILKQIIKNINKILCTSLKSSAVGFHRQDTPGYFLDHKKGIIKISSFYILWRFNKLDENSRIDKIGRFCYMLGNSMMIIKRYNDGNIKYKKQFKALEDIESEANVSGWNVALQRRERNLLLHLEAHAFGKLIQNIFCNGSNNLFLFKYTNKKKYQSVYLSIKNEYENKIRQVFNETLILNLIDCSNLNNTK